MKYYVIAPFTHEEGYFTKDKAYLVELTGRIGSYGRSFYLTKDDGCDAFCLEFGCSYLNGGNWTILEEPDEDTPQQSTKTASECQAEMLCSFYKAISQAGGAVDSFDMDMTLRDIVGRLAQNGVRFTYNKADKCNK